MNEIKQFSAKGERRLILGTPEKVSIGELLHALGEAQATEITCITFGKNTEVAYR